MAGFWKWFIRNEDMLFSISVLVMKFITFWFVFVILIPHLYGLLVLASQCGN